ncbi:MAG: DUF488 domain-containing protein [Sulfobacillus acidophilus]|uniref:DUF488 domain-containing protein n=1 Tax=Sulfobacillus acidophilus TaxID=53633 RepID=A0A2T2WI70_9FIRM|nr:MAG: DUF488 domain-containing protein [Sulfobacillus acidophilus]
MIGLHEISLGRTRDASPSPVWRVLVDRLWPRAVAKTGAAWDEWIKDARPSAELRQWYGHKPERQQVFRDRYWHELVAWRDDALHNELMSRAKRQPVMLLTATKDVERSHLLY